MALPDKPQFEGQVLEHYHLMDQHINRFFPNSEVMVYEELESFGFRVDVFRITPPDKSFQILLTSGLSTMAMPLPKDHPDPDPYRYVELMMVLPQTWRFSRIVPNNPDLDWPITLLQLLARVPAVSKIPMGIGDVFHKNQINDILNIVTPFEGCTLLPPVSTSDYFNQIFSEKGPIRIYNVFPLYKDEMEFISANGFISFKEILQNTQAKEILNIRRQTLVPR